MANSAPNTETWEAMLERLAGKTSIANEAATLIDALTTPPTTTATHTDEQAICPRRLNESAAGDQSSSDLVHSLTTPSSAAPGQKLDSTGLSDIGPLKCRTCGKDYIFTAGEQPFYAAKQFGDQPKSCKAC